MNERGIKHVLEDGHWDDYRNEEFPPIGKMHERNGGYKTWQENLLFHDYAAIGYDMQFRYKGDLYQFYNCPDGTYLIKNGAIDGWPQWPSGNDMIREFKLDGKPIYERFDELMDFELF